jgi:uncharacterized LabA/DUF88 family protein
MSHSINNKGNIFIFIDGNNLFTLAQQLNIEIDYIKLLKVITSSQKFVKPYFYGIIDSNNEKQLGFYTWLKHNGYRVITKSHSFNTHLSNDNQHSNNNSNNNGKKPSLDVDIAVDLIKFINKYDTAILVGLNNDILSAVQYITNVGCRVEYIGLKNMLSSSFFELLDKFTDINDIKSIIEKQNIPIHEKYNQLLNQVNQK